MLCSFLFKKNSFIHVMFHLWQQQIIPFIHLFIHWLVHLFIPVSDLFPCINLMLISVADPRLHFSPGSFGSTCAVKQQNTHCEPLCLSTPQTAGFGFVQQWHWGHILWAVRAPDIDTVDTQWEQNGGNTWLHWLHEGAQSPGGQREQTAWGTACLDPNLLCAVSNGKLFFF